MTREQFEAVLRFTYRKFAVWLDPVDRLVYRDVFEDLMGEEVEA